MSAELKSIKYNQANLDRAITSTAYWLLMPKASRYTVDVVVFRQWIQPLPPCPRPQAALTLLLPRSYGHHRGHRDDWVLDSHTGRGGGPIGGSPGGKGGAMISYNVIGSSGINNNQSCPRSLFGELDCGQIDSNSSIRYITLFSLLI